MKNMVSRIVLVAVTSTAALPARAAGAQAPDTLDSRLSPPISGGGLTSEQVAARAKETSFDAAQKREALNAAEAKLDEALVAYYPKLQLTARYQRLSPITQPVILVNGTPQVFPSF